MNPQNNFKWQQAFGELKAKLERSPLIQQNSDSYLAVGAIIVLTVFNSVVQLISSLMTLAVLGVLIYIAYKLAISPQSSNTNDK